MPCWRFRVRTRLLFLAERRGGMPGEGIAEAWCPSLLGMASMGERVGCCMFRFRDIDVLCLAVPFLSHPVTFVLWPVSLAERRCTP